MDYWKHSLISAKKFGGDPRDYLDVHRFIDSSKLFYANLKHRMLLHSTYGAEIAIQLFGDFLENTDGNVVLIRDIVHAHCREDLDGRVPTLADWLHDLHSTPDWLQVDQLTHFDDPTLDAFLWRPYLRSGIDSTLAITFSDFGIYLVERFFGSQAAREVTERIAPVLPVRRFLNCLRFRHHWQYSPRQSDLDLLVRS